MLLRPLWPLSLLMVAPPTTRGSSDDLAALRAGLGSRCDLEVAPCEGAAAGAITRRVRD
eukprot:COSAG04_NODE_15735_length_522_cov_0.990544_1_plen_58_part_01